MMVLVHLLGAERWLDFWKLFMEKNDSSGAEELREFRKMALARRVLFGFSWSFHGVEYWPQGTWVMGVLYQSHWCCVFEKENEQLLKKKRSGERDAKS